MIGSFWNLCRACPSMPVDKQLHSEYRSTYRWHEFTGNSRPEVVRRAPAPNPSQFIGSTNEPPLPRRKKCPELAYKSHEFIIGSEYTDARNNAANRMARSEERGTPSRRSKSEGPPAVPNGRAYPIPVDGVDGTTTKQAGESHGLFKKTITKLSTEYRLQFVWPNVRRIRDGHVDPSDATVDHPRKSISMGALRANQLQQQQQQTRQLLQKQQQKHQFHNNTNNELMMRTAIPTVHKKRTANQKEATLHELEPLVVSDADDRKSHEKQVTIVEKKVSARPFSQTFDQERINHFITKRENFGFDTAAAVDNKAHQQQQQPPPVGDQMVVMNGSAPPHSQPDLDVWFKEVVELRKKAGEYKCRGWGIEIDPDMYKKQKDLWDQVSKRSSLSALSLASSVHRPITKEEKEEENNKKSIPLSRAATAQQQQPPKPRLAGQAFLIDNKDDISALPARFNNVRHHLERTTGPDVEEGALLPSPTREKLMPAMTKRESESQRGSPKKTALSRHGSPQKTGSPQKGSPKKILKTRSQSVGPGVIDPHESPKRQLRSASTAPSARTASAAGKKTPSGQQTIAERKARPSSLPSAYHNRNKSSSQPPPTSRTTHKPSSSLNHNAHTSAVAAAVNQLHKTNQKSPQKTSSKPKIESNANSLSKTRSPQPQPLLMRKQDKDKTNMSSVSGGSSSVGDRADRADRACKTGDVVGGRIDGGVADTAIPKMAAAAASDGILPADGVIGCDANATLLSIAVAPKKPRPISIIGSGRTSAMPTGATTNTTNTTTAATTRIGSAIVGGDVGVVGGVIGKKAHFLLPPSASSGQDNKLAENESGGEDGRDTAISVASCSPQPPREIIDEQPIVKSPPEPTRVKSPEQIIMRSPDPVNWTVPLDTGKTFTVTQNVKEGENYSRPQSEIKASTPVEKPPPPPQSAPPEFTEQTKLDAWKHADRFEPKTALKVGSPTAAAAVVMCDAGSAGKLTVATTGAGGGLLTATRYDAGRPVPGTSLRCLDAGDMFDEDVRAVVASAAAGSGGGAGGDANNSPSSASASASASTGTGTGTTTTATASTARTAAADVLEKARDRFDRFWGGNKEERV